MPEKPLSVSEFAAKIKAKYPEYKDVDDIKLTDAIIKKYPTYKDKVQFDGVKKKTQEKPSFQSFTPSFSSPIASPRIPTVLKTDKAKQDYQTEVDKQNQKEDDLLKSVKNATKAYETVQGKNAVTELAKAPLSTHTIEQREDLSDGEKLIAPFISQAYNVSGSIYKLPKFIYGLAAAPQNMAADLLNIPELRADYETISQGTYNPLDVIDRIGDGEMAQSEKWRERQQKYDGSISEQLSKGDFSGAGRQVLDNITGSIPALASMYATGGMANAAKLGSVGKNLTMAIPFASSKYNEIQESNIPEYLKPVAALATGLSEVVLEGQFGTKAILDDALKQGGEMAKKSVKDFVTSYLENSLKKAQPLTDVLKNSMEEVATQLTQNIIDKYSGVDSERDLMAGVADAMLVGGAQGAGARVIGTGLGYLYNKKIDDNLQGLTEAREGLADDLDNPNLPDDIKEDLSNRFAKITDKINSELDKNREVAQSLSTEDKAEIEKLTDKVDKLKAQAETEGLSKASKSIITGDLTKAEEKLNILLEEAQGRVTNATTTTDTTTTESTSEGSGSETLDTAAIQEDGDTSVELEIEGEVKTPSQKKIAEIKAKRSEIMKRLASKASNLSSGFNPEVIGDLVELGATYIEEGMVRFSDFASRLKADFGKEIPNSVLREVYKGSAEKNGLGVRGFTESIQEAENISQEVKQEVDNSDNSLYQRQNHADIQSEVSKQTDIELELLADKLTGITQGLKTEDNNYVAAGIELMERYSRDGKVDEANRITEKLLKNSTVIAQTLAQYRLLKKTPKGFSHLIAKTLAKYGRELTANQKQKIEDLFKVQTELFDRVKEAREIAAKKLDKQSRKDYYKTLGEYEQAVRNMDRYIASLMPRRISETLSSIMKLAMLTFRSIIANPVYNALYMPIVIAKGELANIIDAGIAKTTTGRRTKASGLNSTAIKHGIKSLGRGLKVAISQAKHGSTPDVSDKYDVSVSLNPMEAIKRLAGKGDPEVKRRAYDKLHDAIEGIVGIPATVFARLLPFGDLPFSEMVKNHRLYEIATVKGLKGDELESFMLNPDEKSLKDAIEYGKEATFQDDNNVALLINTAARAIVKMGDAVHPHIGGAAKLVVTTNLPFVKTPSSVALKIFNYANPAIPFIRTAIHAKKFYSATTDAAREKHQRLLSEAFADSIISSVMVSAAATLVAHGLTSGAAPEDREKKAEKDFMYATIPPMSINISGFIRLAKGEDPTYQKNDTTVSYSAFGVLGAIIGIVHSTKSDKLQDELKKAKKIGIDGLPYHKEESGNGVWDSAIGYVADMAETLPASLKFMFEQAFMQGMESVITSIMNQEYDKWVMQMYKASLNIIAPNFWTQLNKSWRDNMKDPYVEGDNSETYKNVLKEKYGVGLDDMPNRLNIWGEDVKQSPEGSNPFIYQAVDPFRAQAILGDDVTFNVYQIYTATKDKSAIPPVIPRELSVEGERLKLTKSEHQELVRMVGAERKLQVEEVLYDYDHKTSNHEEYLELLKEAYSIGFSMGKQRFIDEKLNR